MKRSPRPMSPLEVRMLSGGGAVGALAAAVAEAKPTGSRLASRAAAASARRWRQEAWWIGADIRFFSGLVGVGTRRDAPAPSEAGLADLLEQAAASHRAGPAREEPAQTSGRGIRRRWRRPQLGEAGG